MQKLSSFHQFILEICVIDVIVHDLERLYPFLTTITQTNNMDLDWTPVKYLNVLHQNRTKKQLRHFFLNILLKYYQIPILGTLDMSGHFHQKQ